MRSIFFFTALSLYVAFSGCNNTAHKKTNRLEHAASPYLRTHADNTVDWYEWGDEALDRARKENKPVLVSIGYSACHWCHVMEKESYQDTGIARILNENFICIKVDREERPDIDNVYSTALQLLSGNSGWPLHAFALPDGKPFFAGTYFPKSSFRKLLLDIANAYKNKHALVVTQANALTNGMAENNLFNTDSSRNTIAFDENNYKHLFDSVYQKTDIINGGIKGAPKFPTPVFAEFMLQHYYTTNNSAALRAATVTLKKMALGGLYDQVAGGFARYTTDSSWHIPHFEKMLYDNGQLISLYAHAYQLTKDDFFKNIFTETIEFISNNLAAPGGGYYSSLNADTEDGEGAYYAWSAKEFNTITGNNTNLSSYYHITTPGNWNTTANILYATETPDVFATARKTDPAVFVQQLQQAKQQLLAQRSKRVAPSADTKIIAAWNAIMLKGLADAYAATGTSAYLEKAVGCARFIERELLLNDGGLQRTYIPGGKKATGFLDDYAWTATAFTRLYEISFDDHWLQLAKKITDYTITNFLDKKSGLFFYTKTQAPGGLQKIDITDGDVSSPNALMAKMLRYTGIVFDDTAYTTMSNRMLSTVAGSVSLQPVYHLEWCRLAGLLNAKNYEVVIMGKEALQKNKELQLSYLPTCITAGSATPSIYPLLKDRWVEGKTMIYVCTGSTCRRPEEMASKAIAQITQ